MKEQAQSRVGLLIIGIVFLLTACVSDDFSNSENHDEIKLSAIGSFSAGGGLLGNNDVQSLSCDHGHVEYFIPQESRQVSLFMWHSSSVGVWQNRWDGGEGYLSIFLKQGYPVYLWDGPRVGRANWGCEEQVYTPILRDQANFLAWRFGPRFGEWFPGVQFPVTDNDAWNQATRARYNEFDTLNNALLQANAAALAIEQIGPVVALTNSAGGWRAMMSRLKTDNIVGIVAYETPGFIFPEEEGFETDEQAPFGPLAVPLDDFRKLTEIPIQLVFGDNTEGTQWEPRLENARRFADIINAYGGDAQVLVLPEAGLHGNTHIPMADLNNSEVAELLMNWLQSKGLD